ncbi:glycosyltransferase family 2 protein [Geotalea uraniireducens]|uniref:Glycosyl transferase, family 2 n=1 Tax=Geotalea uraniireducens (strain Rf4) TaxID=351605 RepID=A5G838_GEOUR|nr:glycosyltransferase family 2 protein [Geotalea uraniireducens]ABQ27956.1 glycosyl transferase, family 2 [Geotalea uraniireducens Rf4]
MESNRKVSIVTPTYNAVNDIETCLLSVAHQTYKNKEHLIIDGASTDATLEIVKRYADKYSHIKFISEKDNGIYDAMNKAIDLTSGEWIYFLGCDDVFYNDTVLEEIFNIGGIDLFDVVYGNVLWGDTGKIYDGKFSTLKLMDQNICHQAIFYEKSIFSKLGKFDTKYKILADYVFNMKWFNNDGVRSKYVNNIIAKYGINGRSSNVQDMDFWEDRALIYKENFPAEYVLFKDKLQYIELDIKQKEHQLAERDRQLTDRDRQLADRDQRITDLINSFSWRITKPLRWLNAVILTKLGVGNYRR